MEVKEGLLELGGEEANDNMPRGTGVEEGWKVSYSFVCRLFVLRLISVATPWHLRV